MPFEVVLGDPSVTKEITRLLSEENGRLKDEVRRLRRFIKTLNSDIDELHGSFTALDDNLKSYAVESPPTAKKLKEKKSKKRAAEADHGISEPDILDQEMPKAKRAKKNKDMVLTTGIPLVHSMGDTVPTASASSQPTILRAPLKAPKKRSETDLAHPSHEPNNNPVSGHSGASKEQPNSLAKAALIVKCHDLLKQHPGRGIPTSKTQAPLRVLSSECSRNDMLKALSKASKEPSLKGLSTCLLTAGASLDPLSMRLASTQYLFVLPKFVLTSEHTWERAKWTFSEPISLFTGQSHRATWSYQGEFQSVELLGMPETEYQSDEFWRMRRSVGFCALPGGLYHCSTAEHNLLKAAAASRYPETGTAPSTEVCIIGFWYTGWNAKLADFFSEKMSFTYTSD